MVYTKRKVEEWITEELVEEKWVLKAHLMTSIDKVGRKKTNVNLKHIRPIVKRKRTKIKK